jgi:hypothetical protein
MILPRSDWGICPATGLPWTFDDLTPPVCDLTRVEQPVGRFQDLTDVQPGQSRLWWPTEPWQVWLDERRLFQMLPYFPSDGASVPRLLWPLCSPIQCDTFPAVLFHDGGYGAELQRQHANDLDMRRLMLRNATRRLKADFMFGAVWTCGWTAYRRHTPETIAAARQFCRIVEFPQIRVAA